MGECDDMLTKDYISNPSRASEIKMDVETESGQTNEPIDEGEDILFTAEDSYNFDVSVAVTDLQSDEIDAEFADAIKEIDGTKNFPCSHCEKVCKSKGTLTINKSLGKVVLRFVKRQLFHLLRQ